MGRRISKEFLHPSILEGVNNKIGNLDSLETDAKGNMVQAINELVEKLDNSAELEVLEGEIAEGKELIANAVGEPLTAEESFDEMSNDINSLLSTFKTNMMNNGITVESGDKFKVLIDKIATMVEEGEGKGIQFAEGNIEIDWTGYGGPSGGNDGLNIDYTFDSPLSFTPTYFFVLLPRVVISDNNTQCNHVMVSNIKCICTDIYDMIRIDDLDSNGFTLYLYGAGIDYSTSNNISSDEMYTMTYYAIGVGEEDNTLRDSLASILENKGVDVTEEDDMASLITKVDNMSVFQYGDTEGYDYNIAFVNKETVTGNTYTTVLEKIIPSGISVVRLELFLQAGTSSSVKAYCTVKHLRGETVLYENEYSSNSYGSYQEKGNTFEVIEGDVVQVQLKAGDAYSSAIISNVLPFS